MKREFDNYQLKRENNFKERFHKLKAKSKYPLHVLYAEAFEEYLDKKEKSCQ